MRIRVWLPAVPQSSDRIRAFAAGLSQALKRVVSEVAETARLKSRALIRIHETRICAITNPHVIRIYVLIRLCSETLDRSDLDRL